MLQGSKNGKDCNSLVKKILTLGSTLRNRTYRSYQSYIAIYKCGKNIWNSIPIIMKIKSMNNELEIRRKLPLMCRINIADVNIKHDIYFKTFNANYSFLSHQAV